MVLVGNVDGQGPGRRVGGADPARHPEVGEPPGLVWVVLLEGLAVVVGLLGAGRVVREGLGSVGHLPVTDLTQEHHWRQRANVDPVSSSEF